MHRPVYKVIVRFAQRQRVPLRRIFYPPLRRIHPITTDRFISKVYFRKNSLFKLLGELHHLAPGVTEIHCHPGYVDSILPRLTTWCKVREKALEVCTDPRVIRALHAPHVRLCLIHFGDLKSLKQRREKS